jgi:SAM-dependent methyltransferase
MKCCFCPGTAYELFIYTKPVKGEISLYPIESYPRKIYMCQTCNHCQEVLQSEPVNLYAGLYSHTTYGSIEAIYKKYLNIRNLPANKSDNAYRVRNLNKWCGDNGITKPGKLLDVGSGLAVFPKCMQELGWDVSTIDLDFSFVEHAKALGLKSELVELGEYPIDTFDLITFNKVLEHVKDPVDLIKSSFRLLKLKGLIYLEVPDSSSYKLGKEREEFLSGHIHVFSKGSIFRMLSDLQINIFNIENLVEPSGKYTIRVLCGF